MKNPMTKLVMLACACGVSTSAMAQSQMAASAAQVSQDVGVGEIIVTAQKREQSINKVGMAIQAVSGDSLKTRGVENVADLAKVIPGFTATTSNYATPVYTLRGIGLYDSALASAPSVAVYTDQIPRNYPVMTGGVALDLERVEVLKGPQGTLFGQSSTGGAINYVTAKPTKTWEEGVDISYERFGKASIGGFISGPLSETVTARFAASAVGGGAWQYNQNDPKLKNGNSDILNARLTVDWQASDKLKFEVSATGLRDKSDVQASQFVYNSKNFFPTQAAAVASHNPYAVVNPAAYDALTNPGSRAYNPTFLSQQALELGRLAGTYGAASQAGAQLYLGQAVTPNDARQAVWPHSRPNTKDNYYYQGTLRADLELAEGITLTSVSAYAKQKIQYQMAQDATEASAAIVNELGDIETFNQELRLAGNSSTLHWILGVTYDYASSNDTGTYDIEDSSLNVILSPYAPFPQARSHLDQKVNSYSGFGHLEYNITSQLSLEVGIRYTQNNMKANNCETDPSEGQLLAQNVSALASIFNGGGSFPIAVGQCFALNPTTFRPTLVPFAQTLNQGNLSWRAGATYKFEQGALLYASVSQGYKGGIFSSASPSTTAPYAPAVQEKVVAYEVGIKAPLFDRKLQINAGAFYYDYSDKQVRVRVSDPTFGLFEELANVPKSYVWGLEAEIQARPVRGLTFTANGTYLQSKVTSDFSHNLAGLNVYNQAGYQGNFRGAQLPFTPEWSGTADVQYEWKMGADLVPFVGASLVYHGKNNATFQTPTLPAPEYEFPAYATLDLRAGVGAADGRWSVTAFGRNVTNKYYLTQIYAGIDTQYHQAGMPVTYGIALKLRFK